MWSQNVSFRTWNEFSNFLSDFIYQSIGNFISHVTDNLEIQDLRDCLSVEQEEKNELNKKLQDLEKQCE